MTTDNTSSKLDRLARLIGFLSHDPTNPMLLTDAMNLAIETGDAASTERLLAHVEQHSIDDSQICALAMHLLLQRHDFPAAAAYGAKAVEKGLDHPAVIYNTAFARFYSGDYTSTSALLAHHATQVDSPEALLLHARALHHQELTEEAEPLVVRAIGLAPTHIEARGLLALLRYENDELPGALSLARDVLAEDPDQLDALIANASAHFDQRDTVAARNVWTHTVNVHPRCGRAWSGLGLLEFYALEFDQAEEHLRNAVEYMPDHIGTWHVLSWIRILRGDSASAREALLKAYELDRNFGETHGGLAVVDIMDGLEEEGRFGIRRALKLNPDSLSASYAQMLLLQRQGKQEEARQVVEHVMAQTSPDGQNSGLVLLERWRQEHQDERRKPAPDHH